MEKGGCTFSDGEHVPITLPRYLQVAVGAGFSGHGFKFASVISEILADLTENGESDHDVGMFVLVRFD